jgi:hypothetical protein
MSHDAKGACEVANTANAPHCDTVDGPVVSAARQALELDNVDVVLPFVPADGKQEVDDTFQLVRKARDPAATRRGRLPPTPPDGSPASGCFTASLASGTGGTGCLTG